MTTDNSQQERHGERTSSFMDLRLLADGVPPWAVIGYGILTALLGVAVLTWPGATLLVAIAFLAVQLIVTGVMQLARAVGAWGAGGTERTLLAISGALALLAALLILRKPLQTLVVITLLIGASWVIRGVTDMVSAIPGGSPHRGWNLALGAVSLIAGIYILLNPGISLLTFVWVSGLWMVALGAMIVTTAAAVRRQGRLPS